MTTLYGCKSEIDNEGKNSYRITKFDDDMNVESSYSCTETTCECPVGVRPSCRHRDMLPKFIARDAVNSFWMYDFDRGGWISSDVHLEGALASAESYEEIEGLDEGEEIEGLDTNVYVPSDPGTQMPIAGERPNEGIEHNRMSHSGQQNLKLSEIVDALTEPTVEARSALCTPQSTPLLRRF